MKKVFFITVIYLLFTSAGIFAEGLVSVSVDAVWDMLFLRNFTGEFANDAANENGNVFPYQGGREFKSFQPSVFDDPLEAILKLKYTQERFGGLVSIKATNTDSLSLRMSDWEAWLRLGPWFNVLSVKAVTGNQAQRGQVQHYQNFDDFLEFKNDQLGVMIPINTITDRTNSNDNLSEIEFPYGYGAQNMVTGYANFTPTDSADLFIPAGTTGRLSGILLDIEAKPVTFTMAVGGLYEKLAQPFASPWRNLMSPFITGQYEPDSNYLSETSGLNAAFRAEGANIADMVTLAAFYKYAGMSIKKDASSPNNPQQNSLRDTINAKSNNHEFGLHATIQPLQGLGVTVGYTGLYQILENVYLTDIPVQELAAYWMFKYYKLVLPFYHGIDLRASYTGIDKLSITFNNNLTLSKATGGNNPTEQYVMAWMYEPVISGQPNRCESYLGLYNALGLQYAVTETFAVDFQAANRLGFFSLDWEEEKVTSVTDNLGIYAGVKYSITFKPGITASIRGGFSVALRSYTYQDYLTKNKFKAGYVDFGIPIGVKIEY